MIQLTAEKPCRGGDAAPMFSAQRGWFKVTNNFVSNGLLAALSGSGVKAYLVLLRLADKDGISWPGMATIGRLAGYSERTASSAIDELVGLQLLHRDSGCTGRSNRYRLLPCQAPQLAVTSIPQIAAQVGSLLPPTPEEDFRPFIGLNPDPIKKTGSGSVLVTGNDPENQTHGLKAKEDSNPDIPSSQSESREPDRGGEPLLIANAMMNVQSPVRPEARRDGPGPHGPEGPVSCSLPVPVIPQPAAQSAQPSQMVEQLPAPVESSAASTDRRPPWSKYQPMTKEQKEKWDSYHAKRRARAVRDEAVATESKRRTAERLAALTPEELDELKTKVLATLPKPLAELLKAKDPLKSPMISGLIARELGVEPVKVEEDA